MVAVARTVGQKRLPLVVELPMRNGLAGGGIADPQVVEQSEIRKLGANPPKIQGFVSQIGQRLAAEARGPAGPLVVAIPRRGNGVPDQLAVSVNTNHVGGARVGAILDGVLLPLARRVVHRVIIHMCPLPVVLQLNAHGAGSIGHAGRAEAVGERAETALLHVERRSKFIHGRDSPQ